MILKKTSQDYKKMANLALGRSFLYHFLVSMLAPIPDVHFLERLKCSGTQNLINNCSKANCSVIGKGIDFLKEYLAESEKRNEEDILTEIAIDRTRILRVPSKIDLKPPYEGLYKGEGMGVYTLKVKNFYKGVGIVPDSSVNELPDFLCVELDFMRKMCYREKEQWLSSGKVHNTILIEEKFMREHLGSWAGDYCKKAQKYLDTKLYKGILYILDSVIKMDLDYLGQLKCII
ncbi:MAG: putative dimethyl sulfoxide reductase chaperone [Clostridia bacterium]|nr:putative dimethyl sulfoxide reductase chaperone [Clostridia bacterium]